MIAVEFEEPDFAVLKKVKIFMNAEELKKYLEMIIATTQRPEPATERLESVKAIAESMLIKVNTKTQ